MPIGLSDWFAFEHTDRRVTLLKQTETRLALICDLSQCEQAGGIEWRVFNDPHGSQGAWYGASETRVEAQRSCDHLIEQ